MSEGGFPFTGEARLPDTGIDYPETDTEPAVIVFPPPTISRIILIRITLKCKDRGIIMEISRDRVVGIVLLLMAIGFAVGAWNLPQAGGDEGMGAKFYPLGLAAVLAVLSIILMVANAKSGGLKLSRKALTKGFPQIVGICLLYVVLLPILGFVVCTVAMMLTCFWLKRERKWWLNLTVAVGLTVGIYLLFSTLLKVPHQLMPSFLAGLMRTR